MLPSRVSVSAGLLSHTCTYLHGSHTWCRVLLCCPCSHFWCSPDSTGPVWVTSLNHCHSPPVEGEEAGAAWTSCPPPSTALLQQPEPPSEKASGFGLLTLSSAKHLCRGVFTSLPCTVSDHCICASKTCPHYKSALCFKSAKWILSFYFQKTLCDMLNHQTNPSSILKKKIKNSIVILLSHPCHLTKLWFLSTEW